MKKLLAQALTQRATLTDLEAVPPATIAKLPEPLLLAYSAIMSDLVENGAADADRILDKANGQAEPLREIFIELLEEYQPALVLSHTDPMASGRQFVERVCTRDGHRLLQFWNSVFFRRETTHHEEVSPDGINKWLYEFLEQAKVPGKKGTYLPFQPNRSRVGEVLATIKCIAYLPEKIAPPTWIDGEGFAPAGEIIVCGNGLLHTPTRTLHPHDPRFFTLNALPFDYAPEAKDLSKWNTFTRDLWGDDPQSVETLQEIFGYLLTPDTRQQKIFLIVGPKRSGKGTIARILTGLLGQDNVVAPTLASLGTNFGLAPLIGKRVAIIADARLGGRADQSAVAERLLSISGEDALSIDRKFLSAWTGRLNVRFILLSDELPRISDASGALASRFIVLNLENSFFGKEDFGLTDRLLKELPALLNWSLAGLDRLRARGYFVQPESAAESVQALEDLSSPISSFLRDRCAIENGAEVEPQTLYDAWRSWCEEQGINHPGTIHVFGRDLRAAFPKIRTKRPREGKERTYRYVGLRLLTDEECGPGIPTPHGRVEVPF
jgi:putative DNA primase/helicase